MFIVHVDVAGSKMLENGEEPDTNTLPLGSRCIQGYSGGVQGATTSGLKPCAILYTSVALLVAAPVSSVPEKVRIRPSFRTVVVAYQRPWAMLSTWFSVSVIGSKIVARASPSNVPYASVPPTMSARPSGKNAIPLQNRSHSGYCTTNVPVCRFHTAAL